MTRRKSVFSKWTLVLLVVVFCSSVYSRPQDSSPLVISSSTNIDKDKPTENPIRYKYRNRRIDFITHKLPLVFSHVNKNIVSEKNLSRIVNSNIRLDVKQLSNTLDIKNNESQISNNYRKNRLISAIYSNVPNITKHLKDGLPYNFNIPKNINTINNVTNDKRKPAIKKFITKWTDNTKDEDLDFTYKATTSDENKDLIAIKNIKFGPSSKENVETSDAAEKVFNPEDITKLYNIFRKKQKHKPQHTDTVQVYSDNIHIADDFSYPNPRPTYIFTTPFPTPIITNLGEPKPWSKPSYPQTHYRPTTKKPQKVTSKPLKNQYNYHNAVHNNYPHYPDTDFGVSTFPPSTAYTDRIVIRPEEYSGSPYECPTIFLTLNNTFEGQAKEACPDLNIAVNTNVVNKNVVVESEEDEADGIFSDGLGVPYEDDSGDEGGYSALDSDENQEQTDSDSVEALDLTNYNANAIQSESAEPATAASKPSAALHKPVKDDDDIFSLSPLLSFFKPAINAMSYLVSVSPFTFGLFSLLLSPLMFILAGTSGVASLLSPFTSAREAPKLVHVYRPHWHWDNQLKTWQLHTFENFNDKWSPMEETWVSRSSRETNDDSSKATFFLKLKEWMKKFTNILRERQKSKNQPLNLNIHRKNTRKKRETWTKRIK